MDLIEAGTQHAPPLVPTSTGYQLPLTQFSTDTGRLPTNAEGLAALLTAPPNLPNWNGPYIQHPANDPWGRPYVYRTLINGDFDLRSAGPDGQPNTRDDIVPSNAP